MRSSVVRSGLLAMSAAAGLFLWSRPAWLFLTAGAVGAAFWWMGRCHHPRPLALLPPVTGEDGRRQPAQWFCAQCGERFPANFEQERVPIPRFSGYDESKAVASARRAADLEQRQRQLAVKRAGMTKRPTTSRPVVSIQDQRRAG